MNITIEKLVEILVREVVTQLLKSGVEINFNSGSGIKATSQSRIDTKKIIDLSGYKTPVLTEKHLLALEPEINEIIIPGGTVLTLGAKGIIKKRKLKINN